MLLKYGLQWNYCMHQEVTKPVKEISIQKGRQKYTSPKAQLELHKGRQQRPELLSLLFKCILSDIIGWLQIRKQ